MRSRWRKLAVSGAVAAVLAAAGAQLVVACITPPPEWASPPLDAPRILHDQLSPPADQYLTTIPPVPPGFEVKVKVDDPTQGGFGYAIFLDYDPVTRSGFQTMVTVGNPQSDVTTVAFDPPSGLTPTACHRIDFVVARSFTTVGGVTSYHTPDSTGGDEVTWFYQPGGTCPGYDAGMYQDGAFPSDGPASDAPLASGQ